MCLALRRFLFGWGFFETLLGFCCCLAEIEKHRSVENRQRRSFLLLLLKEKREAVVAVMERWRIIEMEAIGIGVVWLRNLD